MGYEIRIKEGHGFDADFKMLDTWDGSIVYVEDNGKETHAMSLGRYYRTARGKDTLRRKLNDQRRRLEYHFKSTGKRWEVERKAEADAKRAKEKAENEARRRVRDAAPDLYAVCVELVRGDGSADNIQRALDMAHAALKKAEGPKQEAAA